MTPPAMPTATIPGIPVARQRLLEKLFATQPHLQSVWLFGSRAMGRHQPGSDLDLSLEAGSSSSPPTTAGAIGPC
jgi:predicted nucleotidyltransferase